MFHPSRLSRSLRPFAVAALAGGALLTGAVAMAQTWNGASSDPNDLRYRLDLLDAEISDIRARLGVPGTEAAATGGTGGGASAIEVGRLEAEVARLTGENEQLSFEIRQLRDQLRLQLEDIVFRVTDLEGGDTSTIGSINLGGQQQGSAQATAPVVLSEQADLDRAKLDIQQGRFDQGEGRLQNFLADYPGSSLAGEAHYWLGQSQFVRGSFPAAANTYLKGYQTNQQGAFAPDNLFQLGVTLGRLGQTDAGCKTLREVERRFPDASSSVREGVASELSSLGCG